MSREFVTVCLDYYKYQSGKQVDLLSQKVACMGEAIVPEVGTVGEGVISGQWKGEC